MKQVTIIGAGMAGLLASKMLRSKCTVKVHEKSTELPFNHHAVLRFRSPVVSEATGIPFRKVKMIRTAIKGDNDVADALNYSMKCNERYLSDRSINSGTVVGDRYIAPPNFINLLSQSADITYRSDARQLLEVPFHSSSEVIISTIPMPALMSILQYPGKVDIDFEIRSGCVLKARVLECDAFVSIYDPRPQTSWSRASITGNELAVEFPNANVDLMKAKLFDGRSLRKDGLLLVADLCHQLGIDPERIGPNTFTLAAQSFSKIAPIDEEQRLSFIHWTTDKRGIYSLGRFATWRPGLLLDDLVNDIKLIDRWTDRKSKYEVTAHR